MLVLNTDAVELDADSLERSLRRLLFFDVHAHGLGVQVPAELAAGLTAAIRSARRGIACVKDPFPLPRGRSAAVAREAMHLCDLDAELRRRTVRASLETLAWAARVEGSTMIVSAGRTGVDFPRDEVARLVARKRWTGAEGEHLRRRVRSARAERAARHLDALSFSLDAILSEAEQLELSVAIENPSDPCALPDPAELGALLARFAGARLGAWFHAAHAIGQERLGFATAAEWRSAMGTKLLGCTADDLGADGSLAPPGLGGLDFESVLGAARRGPPLLVEVGPAFSAAEVAAGLAHLRGLGFEGDPPVHVDPFPILRKGP